MSFPHVGNLSEKPEGLSASADPLRLGGQAAMTESDNDVALLMNELVICRFLDFYVDMAIIF